MDNNTRHTSYNSGFRGGNDTNSNGVPMSNPNVRRSGYSQRDTRTVGRTSGDPKRAPKRRHSRAGFAIVFDVFVSAIILLVFYITNYVVEPKITGVALPTPAGVSAAATAIIPENTDSKESANSESTTSESVKPATAADESSWRTKFADKFTNGEVVKTDSSYKSANINVNIKRYEDNGVVYFVTDIYLADIKYLKTAFAKDADVLGAREYVNAIAEENNAIIAINGDLCLENKGFVIRNGVSYETDNSAADALVMYNDGSMQTFTAEELDRDAVVGKGVYQVWTFGPKLLDNGQPMTSFNTTQNIGGPNNPRTAVGYYEPGHYCFVTVDGRQQGYSYPGYSLEQLSQLMYKLGCQVAFNLDGGQSTELVYNYDSGYDYVNKPYKDGRSTSDIVYITDEG